MIGQIDEYYVAAQIRMLRTADKRTILVLEGETDGRFVDQSACDIEIAFGKPNLLGAIDLLEDEGFPGVVGVTDADFDRIIGRKTKAENICLTDFHDLDLTIFSTPALEKFLAEYADKEALESVAQRESLSIREFILKKAAALSYCRYVSERDCHRLYFKDLRHDNFMDADSLAFNEEELFLFVINRSKTRCTLDQLRRLVAVETSRPHDPMQISSGHDVAAILGIGLRKLLGSRRTQQTWASEIEASLRLAFEWMHFSATQLYRCLRRWEANNSPYRIFA